jgi:hypothetical protein
VRAPLAALLQQSFDHFRRCGAGRRECVVFWTGPLDEPQVVDAVVHPAHRSGQGGYEVDVDWLKGFWIELYEQERTVRIQAHTHPHAAFHSSTDDAFAVSQRTGFLSLVIPEFALGSVSLEGAALFELGESGRWRELKPSRVLEEAA